MKIYKIKMLPVNLESHTDEQDQGFPEPVHHFDCVKKAEMMIE
jgi:hypothetical protein